MPFSRMVSTATVVISVMLLGASMGFAQSTTQVPIFVSGAATITLTNATFTGRTTRVALTSPADEYELALIQDGFGTDTKFQYCWAEIHDTTTGSNLTWRVPCDPIRVDKCSLVLTPDGDFRLLVAAGGASTAEFLSGTGGEGVVDVELTDQGDLVLLKANNITVWQSSDNIQRQRKCREAFRPSSGSRRTRFGWFGVACSMTLSTMIMALST